MSLSTPITGSKSHEEDGELSDVINDMIDPTQYRIPSVEDAISANEQEKLCEELRN